MSLVHTLARRVVTTVCVVLVGALFGKCAHATTINGLGGASLEYVAGGVRIADGSGVTFQGRTWENPVNRTSPLKINEQLRIGSVGGRALAVNSARTIGAAALGSAALSVGAAAWGGWQVGSALADYLGLGDAGGGTRLAPCTSSPSGWCIDAGALPTGGGVGMWGPPGGPFTYATREAYCVGRAPVPGSGVASGLAMGGTITGVVPIGGNAECRLYLDVPGVCTGCNEATGFDFAFGPSSGSCAPYVDFLNPAYSNTSPVPGPDGKCPTGGYHSATLGQAQAKLGTTATFPDGVDIGAADRLAEDILQKGGSITGASERTVTGPASASGSPTTTTENKPDGSTVTTTSTPTTNYTYAGDTINYTTTVVTTIDNAGDVTTVTTNTPATGTEEGECANPGTVGCMKPGELPTNAPTWQTREVIFAAEDLGFAGACPAPVHWELPISGVQLDWSYQQACDVAPMIRLALLAIAAIGAISVVIRETSS